MNKFQELLKNARQSKNVSELLAGQPFLRAGTHNVRVTSAAMETTEQFGLVLKTTLESDAGDVHNQQFYCEGKNIRTNEPQIGYQFLKFMTALFQQAEPVNAFADALISDLSFVESITGMRLQVTLAQGPGVQVRALPTVADEPAKFAGFDEDGKQVTDEFDTFKEVRDAAKGAGLRVSFLNITSMRATNADDNVVALNKALAEVAASKRAAATVIAF